MIYVKVSKCTLDTNGGRCILSVKNRIYKHSICVLVWVDAPDYLAAQYCSNLIGNVRCCLNAHFPPQYEWRVFKTGDAKQAANAQLLQQHQGLPFYRGKAKLENGIQIVSNGWNSKCFKSLLQNANLLIR